MHEPALVDVLGEVDRLRRRLRELPACLSTEAADLLAETDTTLAVVREELRVQQEALRAAEARLGDGRLQQEQLWAMLPLPSLRTDDSGRILDANAAATTLLGSDLPDLLQVPLETFFSESERPVLRSAAARAGREGRAHGVPVTLAGDPVPARQLLALPEPWGAVRMVRWTLLPPLPGAIAGSAAATALLQHRAYVCDLDEMRAVLQARDLAELRTVAARLLPPGHDVEFTIVRGDPDVAPAVADEDRAGRLPPGAAAPAREAFRARAPRLVSDFGGAGRPSAVLALPLLARDDVRGVLVAWAPSPDAFTPVVRYLLKLIGLIGATLITHAEDLDLLRDMLLDLRLQQRP